MTDTERKELLTKFLALDSKEKNRLLEEGERRRSIAARRINRRPVLDEDGEEIGPSKRVPTAQEFALRVYQDELMSLEFKVNSGSDLGEGTVVGVTSGLCTVKLDGYADPDRHVLTERVQAHIPIEVVQLAETQVVVGDTVRLRKIADRIQVAGIGSRKNYLSRPQAGSGLREQVIVSNVDRIVIVVSVVAPPLHPRLIDRYLVAIMRGGCTPLLCVNKIDLLRTEEQRQSELGVLDAYAGVNLDRVYVSTATGDGMDELKSLLTGKTCAFVGHSGVGKSSLVNAIAPELNLKVGEVSEGNERGAHTTTSSTLYECDAGMRLIDTPGIRSFGLWDIPRSELRLYFPDFETAAHDCKFRDCQHNKEPRCGVKRAVKQGTLSKERYDTYIRLLGSLPGGRSS